MKTKTIIWILAALLLIGTAQAAIVPVTEFKDHFNNGNFTSEGWAECQATMSESGTELQSDSDGAKLCINLTNVSWYAENWTLEINHRKAADGVDYAWAKIDDGSDTGNVYIQLSHNTGRKVGISCVGNCSCNAINLADRGYSAANFHHTLNYYASNHSIVLYENGTLIGNTGSITGCNLDEYELQLYGRSENIYFDYINVSTYAESDVNTTVNFTAIDDYNSSIISNFSINITWNNGTTQTETTTTGGVYLNIGLHNESLTANITYYNITNYYSLTLYDQAITANTSNTITANVYQAIATLQAYEKITNNSISGVNFYIGSLNGTEFNLTAGTHTVTAEKAGYYNFTGSITVTAITNTTHNLEGMYNSIINVSAINALNNASISSFTAFFSFGENISTTNGSVYANVINNTNYTVNITATNFTSSTNANLTVNASVQNFTIPTWALNSIRVNIVNESSMLTLNVTTVTVHTISNLTTTTNTTTTGFMFLALLIPNEYELRFEAPGFNSRSIFLTVTNDSTQNITVYMTENTTTELQTVEVLDTSNTVIEGAVVWLQKQILNTTDQWITVQESTTDFEGKTTVYVERDTTVFYRFAVIYEGVARPIQPSGNTFTGATSFIPGVTETIQLIIDLETSPTDFISNYLAIVTNLTWAGANNYTANFTWVDGRNTITGALLTIEAAYINESLNYQSIANITASGSSGYLNFTVLPLNNTIWRVTAYITYTNSQERVGEIIKRFEIDVFVEKNTGLLYAVIVLAAVALLTVTLGVLASSLLTIACMLPLTYFKLVDIPTTIITSLLAIAIIFFLRTRKLDE